MIFSYLARCWSIYKVNLTINSFEWVDGPVGTAGTAETAEDLEFYV
jgi:hypothetical protein